MRCLPRRQILLGDAAQQLHRLPAGSVDCAITSPPYYMLRNYGVENQLGLERNVNLWVDDLRLVCRGVARVLKPTGSLWLNLGDSFSRHAKYGAPAKGLLGVPERLLLALMSDGWICRGKVIWAKPNPMPSSVTDRLNMTYEVVYHLVRSSRYHFDLDAIREPHRSRSSRTAGRSIGKAPLWAGPLAGSQDGLRRARPDGVPGHPLGKNPGDVWTIPTKGFSGAHFATFPEALVKRPLLATCPKRVCTGCGQPWQRRTTAVNQTGPSHGVLVPCACKAPSVRGMVVDPFFGSGTVGVVAEKYGRDWVGIEVNPEYVDIAERRLRAGRVNREEVINNNNETRAA